MKTRDGDQILPDSLFIKGVRYSKDVLGLERATKDHGQILDHWRECFKAMQDLGMIKEEFKHGKKED